MGKVFITDEVNDMYTADVTNAGKLKIEDGAALFKLLSSAASTVNLSAQTIASTPCYLKSIILGSQVATASQLRLYNTTTSANNLSAFGSTADQLIGSLHLDASGSLSGSLGAYPRVIPFNVYCSSGLIAAVSSSANMADGYIDCMENITIVYQT